MADPHPKRTTHCSVPGHGTRCEVSAEQTTRLSRQAERAEAFAHEEAAELTWRDAPGRSLRIASPDRTPIPPF